MTDCVLPATGGDPLLVVLLALFVLGTGVALVRGVHRRGLRGGATVVVAVALGAATLVVSDAEKADAQECPPPTTVAPTAAPTTIAATTTAAATTTTTVATTTTSATTTTTVTGGGVPTNPTFPTTTAATTTTSSTTSTVAAPDLTASVTGLQTVFLSEGPWVYTIDVDNIGTVPTDGTTMTFTVSFPFTVVGPGGALLDVVVDSSSASWTMSESLGTPGSPGSPGTPTTVTFTSTSGFVLAAGADSAVIVVVDFLGSADADFSVDVTLPNGIGGETNGTNNTVSYPVVIRPRPPV